LYYDKNGPVSAFAGNVDFSYLINLNNNISLSLGLNIGINHLNFDASKIRVKDPGEAYFETNQSVFNITSGIGATLFSENWFLGIASPNVTPIKVIASNINNNTYFIPHVNLYGGFYSKISYNITYRPSFVLRYAADQPVSLDASMLFTFYDRFTAGISYRLKAAYILLLSTRIGENFMIGYSFDLDATGIRPYNSGSHEIFLRYEFTTQSGNIRFQSPRFF
jgi:type IX secretion system PorP/SprF family membrane protein